MANSFAKFGAKIRTAPEHGGMKMAEALRTHGSWFVGVL